MFKINNFFKRQIQHIRLGGKKEVIRKLYRFKDFFFHYTIFLIYLPFIAIFILVIRIISPFFLIRLEPLIYWRLGHFAANVELYLCEKEEGINVPIKRYFDIWYQELNDCNLQLKKMWMRIINIKTGSFFALADRLNRKIPGFNKFTIGTNTCCDRDVNNLLDKYPAHLSFTQEEEIEGERQLKLFGVPNNGKFICITVRDSAYLDNQSNSSNLRVDWSYHNYRDGDIQNYVPALVALAEKGYVIFRMGAVVNKKMSVSHKNIIDYAVSDLRNDFMDIYLGAKCEFCISTGTGFDAVPFIFRRPIIYMNHVPLGIIATFSDKFIATTKLHWLKNEKRYMNFKEIFDSGAGYFMRSSEFESSGIDLIETSPEEIIEGVMEMESRIKGEWEDTIQDTELQKKFWEVFQKKEMHGEIKSKISTTFLRRYQYLL